MLRIALFTISLFICSNTLQAERVPWEHSPRNWKNSPYNFDNSTRNPRNKPSYFANRSGSSQRLDIINTLGVSLGYAIIKNDGGINYFDNDGDRIGYSPDGGQTQYTASGNVTKFKLDLD